MPGLLEDEGRGEVKEGLLVAHRTLGGYEEMSQENGVGDSEGILGRGHRGREKRRGVKGGVR